MPQFKLRSPVNATQEEIELTKRYIGFNEQIKQSKKIEQSVIKGRRYTVDPTPNTSVMTKNLFSDISAMGDHHFTNE
jgi:hypothetical protein